MIIYYYWYFPHLSGEEELISVFIKAKLFKKEKQNKKKNVLYICR